MPPLDDGQLEIGSDLLFIDDIDRNNYSMRKVLSFKDEQRLFPGKRSLLFDKFNIFLRQAEILSRTSLGSRSRFFYLELDPHPFGQIVEIHAEQIGQVEEVIVAIRAGHKT